MNSEPLRATHHVVAGLLVQGGMVLLCHRSAARRWYPSVWDLPGGHIEPGEPAADALVRELSEELGILVPTPTAPPFAQIQGQDFDCRIWLVEQWGGTPSITSEEHDDMRWFAPLEVDDLPLAVESYRPLLTRASAGRLDN
jgi:8-oxo-dGTP diphosphatase